MKSVIFIAPPAAGKGTQSTKLENLGYVHISAGDLLREEITKNTTLGQEIKDILASGKLVDDMKVHELIKNKLVNIKKPFVLDGYPRTINQTHVLDELLKDLNINNYEVIYFDISVEEALKRALGRLTCICGASYNKYYDNLKPQIDGICDKCGSNLIIRDDDNEESFKVRFETFRKNIEPIIDYYKNIGKLHFVNAMESSEKITDRIKEILND